jgi:uncharacterized SAM-binding protein YcdF (DUF218 family)
MFFILSKTLSLLLEPLVIPYVVLALALIAKWRRRRRSSRILVGIAIILPVLYGVIPLSSLPLQILENRINPATITERQIDGIIVLGGFTGDGVVAESRNQPTLGSAAERFTSALQWHRIFPEKPLIFSGFSGRLIHKGKTEAEIAQQLLDDLGVDRTHILFEDSSRNSFENAVNSHILMAPTPASHWLLITSAAHMPRAIGSFRAAGWAGILGYPVDYQTPVSGSSELWNMSRGTAMLRIALHEYGGLLIYWLTGRSAALWPS